MALDVAPRRAGAKAPAAETDLKVEGLAKRFGEAPVFENVSFSVGRGEAVALVGANGTGKSTLLRCCLRLIRADAGQVEFLGEDVLAARPANLRRLRAKTGLVAQKHNLSPRLSVLSNVIHGMLGARSGPRWWLHSLAPQDARERAMEALERVGMADFALRRADRLSGGQGQRVAIARALVHGPRLIAADEPTASLDPAAGEEVMALFFDLARRQGVTVVFVSHNLDHALSYGDRVLGLKDGGLKIDAAAGDLSERDLRSLYD